MHVVVAALLTPALLARGRCLICCTEALAHCCFGCNFLFWLPDAVLMRQKLRKSGLTNLVACTGNWFSTYLQLYSILNLLKVETESYQQRAAAKALAVLSIDGYRGKSVLWLAIHQTSHCRWNSKL